MINLRKSMTNLRSLALSIDDKFTQRDLGTKHLNMTDLRNGN